MGDKLLTVADAAKRAGVTPDTIRSATRRGRLRCAAVTEGGWRLFRGDDVDEWRATVQPRRPAITGGSSE